MRLSLFALLLPLLASCAAAPDTRPLPNREVLEAFYTRGDQTQSYALTPVEQATAHVILMIGGKGTPQISSVGDDLGVRIVWGKNNFLVRERHRLAHHGFNVALLDGPSDHATDLRRGYRTSDAAIEDVQGVIEALKKKADLPVWLVGISRGSEMAAYVGQALDHRVAGVVLLSAMTEGDYKGKNVMEALDFDPIQKPVLVVHHMQDGCLKSRPEDIEPLFEILSRSGQAEIQWYKGGKEALDAPCQGRSKHGFYGIEEEVIGGIGRFIRLNAPKIAK
ncbi:alpha/beta hydrolase [Magnetococcus sp. PR-3]|uniref:alpha/beta hydrolase n=1 Tax=Magnetococcus sp. PR-3 TaxID=3120355 RepID=UPI002FCE5473